MKIAVPESYRDHVNDKIIQSVVDHLLAESDKNLPVDEWDEIPAYYQAWLSAQKVKTDYALFLFSLWDAIWRPALQTAGIHDEFSIHEEKKWDKSYFPSRNNLWDMGGLHRSFKTTYQGEKISLHTRVGDITGNDFSISAYACDAEQEEITERLVTALPTPWKKELDDDGWCTVDEALYLILKKETTEIDVTSLQLAAKDLLSVVGS